MNIDSIENGVVLDHICAGRSMDIYRYLKLDRLDCCVAIIKNVRSNRMGKKDIIKIDASFPVNLDTLGYIDPGITVNIIQNGHIIAKRKLDCPDSWSTSSPAKTRAASPPPSRRSIRCSSCPTAKPAPTNAPTARPSAGAGAGDEAGDGPGA